MIITGTHWFVAALIAVVVHLAGALWLMFASPSQQPRVENAGDGIVVTLGRADRDTAGSPQLPEVKPDASVTSMAETQPQPSTAEEPAAEEAAAEEAVTEEPAAEEVVTEEVVTEEVVTEPAATEPAAREADAEAEPEAIATPDASVTDAISPDTVESRQLADTAAVEPESARDQGTPEPESIAPDAVETRQAADASEAPTTPSGIIEESSVPAAGRLAVEEMPRPVSPAESAETAESPETTVVTATDTPTEPDEAIPRELTDDAPEPEAFEAPEAAREVPTEGAEPAPSVDAPVLDLPPAEPVDGVAAVLDEQSRSRPALPVVEPESASDTDPRVAVAREPAPEVQQASEAEVTETAAPETVKLQDLEERAGGRGVVAHYAGVLKGWLQRNMHYPRAARLAGQEGDVVVRFVIDRDGNVQSVELESGSGYPLLDREATEMVERGDPFPEMPGDMPGERLEVRVPVSFHVRDETRTRDLPPIDLE